MEVWAGRQAFPAVPQRTPRFRKKSRSSTVPVGRSNTEFIASYRGLTRAPCPAYFGVLVGGKRTLLQSQIRFDLRRLEVDVEVLAVPWLP